MTSRRAFLGTAVALPGVAIAREFSSAQRQIVLLSQNSGLGGFYTHAVRLSLPLAYELDLSAWQRNGVKLLNTVAHRHCGKVVIGAVAPDLAVVLGEVLRGAGARLWLEGSHTGRRTGGLHRLRSAPHAQPVAAVPATADDVALCARLFAPGAYPAALDLHGTHWLEVVARVSSVIASGAWQPAEPTVATWRTTGARYDLESFVYAL